MTITVPTLWQNDTRSVRERKLRLLVEAVQALVDAGGGGGAAWGDITGTLASQADLQAALDAKLDDSQLDTDGTLAANSDAKVASQKAVKTYVDAMVTGLLDFKGSTNCSGNPNYPAASKGDAYVVSVAGKIGGASGASVEVGDLYVASADNAGGTQAAVGTSWFVLEHNLAGALLAANNLSDLTDPAAARTALSLGAAALLSLADVDERARDAVGNALTGTAGITFTPNDGGDSIALTATGRLIGKQTITATGAGTYTPTTGTQSIVIELQGAGGGGGGVASPGASNVARAFAGASGGYLRKRLTANFSGASYSVGAKGTGGAAGNNNGNNGGDTTFTDTAGSPTVYTASGGAGGSGSTGFAPPLAQAGSAGGGATNGDINIQGGPTKPAVALAATALIGAGGGDAHLGFGAAQKALTAAASTSNGNNAAAGYGGGGGGGIATTTGAAASGGDGANGVIIIWEYS